MGTITDKTFLVQISQEKWKSAEVIVDRESVSLLDRDTHIKYLTIQRQCCLRHSIGDEQLVIHAIPKINHRRRFIQVRFEGDKDDLSALQTLLKRYGFACPERKKLLVFVNPFSGTKVADRKWKSVNQLLEIAGVDTETVITRKQNHAFEAVQQTDISLYSGVVTVSGDGLVHEVLNGLYSRKDWDELRGKFPLGIVPGGSGNAIHCSILHQQKEDFGDELLAASLNLARGSSTPVDYIECETENRKFLSMFGVAWGLIPDCDISSEVIRWAGFARVYIWLFFRIVKPRIYRGKVHYLPRNTDEDDDVHLTPLNEPVPSTWTTIEGEFLAAYACKQSFLDYSTRFIPDIRMDDGNITLVIFPSTIHRLQLIRFLLNPDDHSTIQTSGVQMINVSAFRFEMEEENDPLTVDAEKLTCNQVQGRIVPRGSRLLLRDK